MFRLFGCFVLILLLFASVGLAADHHQYLFEQGNQAYQEKKYEEAIRHYLEILGDGYESADLYYNIGNCYYKTGDIARAILFYERALKLKPNDEDVQFNLQIARLNLVDEIPELPELFYLRFFRQFRALFSLESLTALVLVLYVLAFGFASAWIINRKLRLRRLFKTLTVVCFVLLLFFALTFYSKIQDVQKNIHAIVLAPEVVVRSAPSEDATEIFTIHEGLKVKITAERGDWLEIRLPDGKEGWLPAGMVEAI